MSVETKLTIEAPDRVLKGEKFNVTGTLTRKDTGEALDGMPVDLYVNGVKAASTTTVKGAYSFEVAINELKSHTVKAVFPGYTTRGKINVRAYADGTEVKVRVKGQYPAGEWDTPFSIELEEGVVATFVAPTSIVVNGSPYGLTAVEGGSWIGDGTFKAVCPANVSLKYSRTPAKWRWSGGEGSYLEVYDAAYRGTGYGGSVYTKFSFIPGRDYRAVALIWLDTPGHGFLLASGLTGYQEREYSIDAYLYALEFDVQPAWGGYAPVVTIRREEMRSY